MTGDWVHTRARFPGRCRKGSGGCGRPIQREDRVWLRRPVPGKRVYSVLICHNCGVANGLRSNAEAKVPAHYDPDAFLPPGDR
jgi:hypothetical protein